MAGRIRLVWRILCGKCYKDLIVSISHESRKEVKAVAKEAGWVWDRRRGWLCPGCQEQLKEANNP